MIKDIARLQGCFNQIKNEIEEKIKLLFKIEKHDVYGILKNLKFYSQKVEDFLKENLEKLTPDQRLVHGDLYINNEVIDNRGDLAYIDLENSKIDWPEKDNTLIILYNPKLYQRIVNL